MREEKRQIKEEKREEKRQARAAVDDNLQGELEPRVEFQPRSSWQIALSVWRALFLREMLVRISKSRSAALWLFFEPVFHFTYMMFVFIVIRTRVVSGIDTMIWLLAGILPFTLFKRVATQGSAAISANTSLFIYRQVKPVDTIFVRAVVELLILLLVAAILFFGVAMIGKDVAPADPLAIIVGTTGLWLFGIGWGLVGSAARELIPESANVVSMLMGPLYLLSGVIFPIERVPFPYRDWLLLNPILHGVSYIRHGFTPYYHLGYGIDIGYLYAWALSLVFLGLALQKHFALKLVAR